MLTGADIQNLKDYVAGPNSGFANKSESTVLLQVTHSNLKSSFMELRFDMHMTIAGLKAKLTAHCGTNPSSMLLLLNDRRGDLISSLNDDNKKLGYYSPQDGFNLHVVDSDPASVSANGWLEDVSKVQKYTMSDADYALRENTYRKFKETKLQEDPSWSVEKEMCIRRGVPYEPAEKREKVDDPDYLREEALAMEVGSRCEVDPGGKRGAIRYIGQCEGLPAGYWIGVQYDEPMGKNDGSVKGKRYFDCAMGYGAMLRPNLVKAGNFPPLDEFAFSDEDEI